MSLEEMVKKLLEEYQGSLEAIHKLIEVQNKLIKDLMDRVDQLEAARKD